MQRRDFVKLAGLAAAGISTVAPARAQSAPQLKWRLTSSYPSSLDLIYGGAQTFAKAVGDATDGRFEIEVHPAGDIVSALDAFDAVGKGTVECAQTALFYYWGAEPALIFATGAPFGMNARQQNAFFSQGGGNDLFNDILVDHNIFSLPAGNTGCQMGGWFRSELNSVHDLEGLKFRISGVAGKILQSLGVVPTAAAGNGIETALAGATLDAAAWVSPYDDEKLGLTKVAPYYYYPGWWEGSTTIHIAINLAEWNKLPAAYQAILRGAAALANVEMQAKYDARNPAALERLVADGAKLRMFPADVMQSAWQSANDFYEQTAAKNERFKRAYEAYTTFRNEEYVWWQVAEYPYDNFIIRQRARG